MYSIPLEVIAEDSSLWDMTFKRRVGWGRVGGVGEGGKGRGRGRGRKECIFPFFIFIFSHGCGGSGAFAEQLLYIEAMSCAKYTDAASYAVAVLFLHFAVAVLFCAPGENASVYARARTHTHACVMLLLAALLIVFTI